MTTKQNSKLPPFHPFFQRSWNAEIWKKVSAEARLVYLALCSKYRVDLHNNGKLHLSARRGAKELGFSKELVARCLRELAYYGFIVQTNAGWHGVAGKGIAPKWRVTELACGNEPATYDFERFTGERFHEQKTPGYYKRRQRDLAKLKALQATKNQLECLGHPIHSVLDTPDTSVLDTPDTPPKKPRKRVSRTPQTYLECSPSPAALEIVEERQECESLEACTKLPAAPIENDDLPTCLRRGHPDCFVRE